jgi:hypothetical protein
VVTCTTGTETEDKPEHKTNPTRQIKEVVVHCKIRLLQQIEKNKTATKY